LFEISSSDRLFAPRKGILSLLLVTPIAAQRISIVLTMKMTMVETKKIEDNPQDYYTYIDPDLLAVILGVKLASGESPRTYL
jgi:hypothetical protein